MELMSKCVEQIKVGAEKGVGDAQTMYCKILFLHASKYTKGDEGLINTFVPDVLSAIEIGEVVSPQKMQMHK